MHDKILKKIDKLINPSYLREIEKLQRSLDRVTRTSAFDRALQSIALQQSAIDKVVSEMARPSAFDKMLQSVVSRQSAMDKAIASMVRPSVIDKVLQSAALQQSAMDEAIAAMTRPSAIDKVLQSVAMQQSAISKSLASVATQSAITNALDSISIHQAELEKTINSFANASAVLLREPACFSEMARIVSSIYIDSVDSENISDSLEAATDKLSDVDSKASLLKAFSNLHPFIQALLFYFLIHVFLPQVNSISANLLTPVVESYLESNDTPDRRKISTIKKLPRSLGGVNTDDLRFITGNNVRLRLDPSTNSEILDELVLGQVVTVLSKKRNWIEVMYEYRGGESLSGWVFTRYTAKFIK